MDEDTAELVFGILFLSLVILLPFFLVLSVTGCVALQRTRKWQKDLAAQTSAEAAPLNTEDEEDDFLDSEDESDHHARIAEEEADKMLSPRQKFRKEFKKCWSGSAGKDAVKQREREERRKVAKAVAREIERLERRRQRKGQQSLSEVLPSYNSATATDRKQ